MSYPGELACMYEYVLVKQKPVQPEAEGRGHPCIVIYIAILKVLCSLYRR